VGVTSLDVMTSEELVPVEVVDDVVEQLQLVVVVRERRRRTAGAYHAAAARRQELTNTPYSIGYVASRMISYSLTKRTVS